MRSSFLAVSAITLLALAGAAVYLALASHSNHASALRWRDRAAASERLLTTRTNQLDTRSKALNRAAGELDALAVAT